jgi:integrase
MQHSISSYLQSYRARLKPSTWQDYASILRLHLARFSDFDSLNQGLEAYLSDLVVTGKRRNNILSAARSFMAWAVRRGLWSGPLLYIPRFPDQPRKITPLAPDEARLVMNFARPPFRSWFRFAILSGLRTGELMALAFDDFDLINSTLHVQRSLSRGKISSPKTLSSTRSIPLFRPLREIYLSRLNANLNRSPWLWYSSSRGLIARSTLSRYWRNFLEVFGIAHRPLYATRHTFASLAVAAGEDPLWIAEVMGHRRPDQLLLRYATYLAGVKEDGKKFMKLALGQETLMRQIEGGRTE